MSPETPTGSCWTSPVQSTKKMYPRSSGSSRGIPTQAFSILRSHRPIQIKAKSCRGGTTDSRRRRLSPFVNGFSMGPGTTNLSAEVASPIRGTVPKKYSCDLYEDKPPLFVQCGGGLACVSIPQAFPAFPNYERRDPVHRDVGSFFGLKVRTDVSPSSLDYKVTFWTRDQLN